APPRSSADATFRLKPVRGESRKDERRAEPFGLCDVTGVVHEAAELRVRDCEGVHSERADANPPDGAFPVVWVREAILAPHQHFPGRQQCHAVPIPGRPAPRDGRPFHDRGGSTVASRTLPGHGCFRLGVARVTGRHSAGVTATTSTCDERKPLWGPRTSVR